MPDALPVAPMGASEQAGRGHERRTAGAAVSLFSLGPVPLYGKTQMTMPSVPVARSPKRKRLWISLSLSRSSPPRAARASRTRAPSKKNRRLGPLESVKQPPHTQWSAPLPLPVVVVVASLLDDRHGRPDHTLRAILVPILVDTALHLERLPQV